MHILVLYLEMVIIQFTPNVIVIKNTENVFF